MQNSGVKSNCQSNDGDYGISSGLDSAPRPELVLQIDWLNESVLCQERNAGRIHDILVRISGGSIPHPQKDELKEGSGGQLSHLRQLNNDFAFQNKIISSLLDQIEKLV